jgi:hypothetical protein
MNPQSWNRYTYVTNNPVTRNDPTGMGIVPCADGATATICTDVAASLGGDAAVNALDVLGPVGMVVSVVWDIFDIVGLFDSGPPPPPPAAPPAVNNPNAGSNNSSSTANKVDCNSVLPNGKTVGDYVQPNRALLQNSMNDSMAAAQSGLGVDPFSQPTGTFYSIAKPNGPIDFKNIFRSSGASPSVLGQAGNFAYYAIGSGILPNAELDVGAGLYALKNALFGAKRFSTLTGPMFSDASAASVRDAGLAANGCAQ